MFLYDAKSGVVEVSSDADADDDINLYHDINELSMNLKIFHFNKYRLEYFHHERRRMLSNTSGKISVCYGATDKFYLNKEKMPPT